MQNPFYTYIEYTYVLLTHSVDNIWNEPNLFILHS